MKKLLLGDEAIAQGALDAGLSGVYAYPGTPSTEITEYIQMSPLAKERGVHSRWSTMRRQLWRLHSACRIWESVRWFV